MKAFVRPCVIGALLCAAAPGHAAEYTASANCGGSQQVVSGSTSAGAECGYPITYPVFGFISASSEADSAGLYVAAHGAGYNDGTADAIVSDNFFVASGVLPAGSPGSLVFTYYVHGLTADPSAMGQVRLTADNPSMPSTAPGGNVVFEQTIQGAATIETTSSLAVGVSLGVPTGIEVDLNLYSLAGYIDFSDTVELVGIKALDSAGNPISGDVTGDGGFDYTTLAADNAAALGLNAAPAPEASTWALIVVGFAGLAYAARRRNGPRRAAA
jgi:hypothetical protein